MNKKKLLALLMALVMTLTLVPVTAFADGDVAEVGETGYATLQAAVDAAKNGGTVKLLNDVTGKGVIIGADYDVIIDFNSHTYTVEEMVGSSGTETCGFQIYNGAEVTLKGGSLAFADHTWSYNQNTKQNVDPRAPGNLIQNYSDLTLDGMTLTTTGTAYALSNNCGNVVLTDVNIPGKVDVSYWPSAYPAGTHVTLESGSIGTFELGFYGKDGSITPPSTSVLTMNGGTVSNITVYATNGGTYGFTNVTIDELMASAQIVKNGATVSNIPDGYYWKQTDSGFALTKALEGAVAQIGDNGAMFTSLKEAIAAAEDGDTIKLLADIDATGYTYDNNRIPISKSLTIDGQNHTITVKNRGFGVGMGASSNIDVTFKDVTIENSSYAARCIDTRGNLNSLTLDHVTLSTDGATSGYTQPLTIGGSQADAATVTIENGSVIQTNDDATKYYAIITYNPVNMIVENSTIKGWACIYAKGPDSSAGSDGSVFTITDSTLVSNNIYYGASNAFAAVMIEDDNVMVNIEDTDITIHANSDQYQGIAGFTDSTAGSVVNLGNGNTVTLSGNKACVTLPSGNYPNPEYQNFGKIAVSGGIFNREIYDIFCADGYAPIANTDPATKDAYPYTVGKIQVTENTTATITTDQSSSVDEAALNTAVSDTEVRTTIKKKTVVSGVQLTNNLTVEENTTSGVQAVVNAAKSDENFSTKLSTASKVEIEVDVKVTPKTFSEEAVTFKLTPIATVKTYTNESEEPSATVSDIEVDNNWIDQTQPITVRLYTNFLPSQIIHRDNDGNVIEVFTGNQIVYDTTTGVATVTISHFSDLEAVQHVAQIGSNKYATLKDAFDAAGNNDTIMLLADISLTERLFVNAGDTPAYDSSNKRYATTSDNKSITLDMNGHNIDSSSNIALAGGSLNIVNTSDPVAGGKISTSASGLAPVEIRGTGNLENERTLTIGSGVTLDGEEYGLNVFGSNDAQKNLIDVNVNGTVNGTLFVLGNLKNTENAINIVVNGKIDGGSEEVGIALNGYGNVTVNSGASVSGKTGIEVRAGNLTVNGGTITGKGDYQAPVSNGSGTTSSGAAVAVAQHTTKLPINVELKGGTLDTETHNNKLVVADPEGNGTIASIDGTKTVSVNAKYPFTLNSTLDNGYRWVGDGLYRQLERIPFNYLGASLRRRVISGTDRVVSSSTDMRFGFEVYNYDVNATYYFQWKLAKKSNWSAPIQIEKFADGSDAYTKIASLVITGIPQTYYSELFDVKIYKGSAPDDSKQASGNNRNVDQIAYTLLTNANNEYHAKWVNYGMFLRGGYGVNSYELVRDEGGTIIGHKINGGEMITD